MCSCQVWIGCLLWLSDSLFLCFDMAYDTAQVLPMTCPCVLAGNCTTIESSFLGGEKSSDKQQNIF